MERIVLHKFQIQLGKFLPSVILNILRGSVCSGIMLRLEGVVIPGRDHTLLRGNIGGIHQRMLKQGVCPDPGLGAGGLHTVDQAAEILPVESAGALADGNIVIIFLVHADMDVLRLFKHFVDLFDQVIGHLAVGLRCQHIPVLAQPLVMGGGEIHLGEQGQTQRPAAGDLFLDLLLGPDSLGADLGMGIVLYAVPDIQHHGVEAAFGGLAESSLPHILVEGNGILVLVLIVSV